MEIFTESLKRHDTDFECRFWANPWNIDTSSTETPYELPKKCDVFSCYQMGIEAENSQYNYTQNRIFYVATTERAPYCIEQN